MNMLLAIVIAAGTVSLPLASQPEREQLRRVAPGYEDFSANALSARVEPVDNRATLFAEDVYEGERHGRFGSSERIYMRMYGGIVAVFPRSSYVSTPQGIDAPIPPGTVFHLGSPEDVMDQQRGAGRVLRHGQVDLRQDLAADAADAADAGDAGGREQLGPARDRYRGGQHGSAEGAEDAQPSVFTSEVYRQRRMAGLLAEAARAERGASRRAAGGAARR